MLGADDDPVVLSWVAPPGGDCPDLAYVMREIRLHVGPARAESERIHAHAIVQRVGATGWEIDLRTMLSRTEGRRVFQDESCRALADAAVVVLAWMIDPQAMARYADQTPPAIPVTAPPPSSEANAKTGSKSMAASRRATATPFAGLAMSGDGGTLPAAALGAELRGGLWLRSFRFGGYGAYWPRSRKTVATLSDGTAVGGRFALWTIGLQACVAGGPWERPGGWTLALCAGPELDVMQAQGFGVNAPGRGTKTWVAATAGVEGILPVSPALQVSLRLTGVVPSQREQFSLRGVGPVHTPSRAAGRAFVGVDVIF